MVCSVCRAECQGRRCNCCSAVANRICRLLANSSEEFKVKAAAVQNSMTKEQFYELAKDKVGQDLEKLIVHTYSVTQVTVNIAEMQGTGEFLDEEELKIKYKDRPLRLQAILKNAAKMYHPTWECDVYEDTVFKRETRDSVKRTEEETLEASTTERVKKIKRAKVAPKPKNGDSDETDDKANELKQSTLTWVDKALTKSEELATKTSEIIGAVALEENKDWVAFMPTYIITDARALSAKIVAFRSELELVKETKICAAIAGVRQQWKDIQEEHKETTRIYKVQKDEAAKVSDKKRDIVQIKSE